MGRRIPYCRSCYCDLAGSGIMFRAKRYCAKCLQEEQERAVRNGVKRYSDRRAANGHVNRHRGKTYS